MYNIQRLDVNFISRLAKQFEPCYFFYSVNNRIFFINGSELCYLNLMIASYLLDSRIDLVENEPFVNIDLFIHPLELFQIGKMANSGKLKLLGLLILFFL